MFYDRCPQAKENAVNGANVIGAAANLAGTGLLVKAGNVPVETC